MDEELKQLKSVLRSLVVASPREMDSRSLWHDYRLLIGKQIPIAKYGYKDLVVFLRDHFSDCFSFQGASTNPILTLIVPDALMHNDKIVQKQKSTPQTKCKEERRSVPKQAFKPVETDLIVNPKSNSKSTENRKECELAKTIKIKQSQPKSQEKITSVECLLSQRFSKSGGCGELPREDDDSGRHTLSSSSSRIRKHLNKLKREIREIIISQPEGVMCANLMRLYNGVRAALQPDGDWLLSDKRAPVVPPSAPLAAPLIAPRPPELVTDTEDALPGIDYDADVFPEDCMQLLESIPGASLADVQPGAMLEVIVGEVYSPSHFWLLRLGERHNIALEEMMDEMNKYYHHREGAARTLSLGATRPGHYCSSCYEGDWHRSVIVRVLDCDTVKVRHVDYGTVQRCEARALRPLLRRWARLEAQAVRALLAGVRPAAAARRWPRPAAQYFLALVCDRRLVANVVAVDAADAAVEVLLIDTVTSDDRCLATELVRADHAESRADSALGVSVPDEDGDGDDTYVRSLPADILRFGPRAPSDGDSDLSASTLQLDAGPSPFSQDGDAF